MRLCKGVICSCQERSDRAPHSAPSPRRAQILPSHPYGPAGLTAERAWVRGRVLREVLPNLLREEASVHSYYL